MLNRRHLRIKVFQALYAYFQSDDRDMPKAERQLIFSVEKFHELYIYLLSVLNQVHRLRIERLELAKKKRIPSAQDLNPSRAFVDNPFFVELEENKALDEHTSRYKMEWNEERMDIIKDFYNQMVEHEVYISFLEKDEIDEKDSLHVLVQIFKDCIANNELVQHAIDEASIFWSDDLDLAASMGLKTIKAWKGKKWEGDAPLLSLFKEEKEEREFLKELFRQTIVLSGEHENLISDKASNWDLDRIAYTDMILMKMALAEARTFKSIPTKVSINEYIELSKYYSTPKSGPFINGILDKLYEELKGSGDIKKMGRGLLES
jgi:transcription antitermination protein NusB